MMYPTMRMMSALIIVGRYAITSAIVSLMASVTPLGAALSSCLWLS